jgi:archaeal cell division control protein 6
MGLFSDILSSEESLFVEPMALDFDYQPSVVRHRENEQTEIVNQIKPLFSKRNGNNLFIVGIPGIGKSVCLKHVLRELNSETDEIHTIFINCWKKDSPFKVVNQICEELGFTWTHNKSYEELLSKALELLNKKSAVIVLDEVDRLTDLKVIYSLLEDVFRRSLILITNHKEFLINLDTRIKSRLAASSLEFYPYKLSQVYDILQQRKDFAFVKDVFDQEAFDLVVNVAFDSRDMRKGLNLLKASGEIAEGRSSRKVEMADVEKALEKEGLNIKEISEESEKIYSLVKENNSKSIKDLYEVYSNSGGKKSYRTFHRRLKELEAAKKVKITEVNKGFEEGRTNLVEVV